jgi:hypothetical protein
VSPTSLALSPVAPSSSFQVLLSASGSGFTLVPTVADIAITDDMILADPASPYTITQSQGSGWLTVDSLTGSTPATVTVTANPAGLTDGQTYTGSLSVAVSGATQSPQTVLVSLTLPAVVIPPPPPPPDTPGGSTGALVTTWDLVLCDRRGTPLGQVLNATGRTLRFALRGTPTLSFTVSTSHPLAPYMLQVDRMLVKAYENSTGTRVLRFIGPVTSVERVRQSATGTLAVVATGPAWRLDRRLIGQTAPGATFGTTPLVLRDRGDMMAALVDALNVGDTGTIMCEANDTGIRRGFIRASSSTYVGPWLWKTAGSVLTDLSSSLDSPDWEVAPVEPLADTIGVQIGRLNVQPVIGSDAPQAAWEYGTGRHNVQTFRDVLDANASANRAIALPPGYPDQTVGDIQVAADTDSKDDRGLLEALVEGDLIADELRRELAEQHIAVRKDPRRIVTFTPVAETPATEADRRVPRLFAEFNVGDFVPFRAVEPIEVWDEEGNIIGFEDRKTIDATFRVYGASVAIDDNGTAITDLTLVQEA